MFLFVLNVELLLTNYSTAVFVTILSMVTLQGNGCDW